MYCRLLSALTLAVSGLEAAGNAANAALPADTLLRQVRETCFQCHGKLENDKPSIEGNFDLMEVLTKDRLDLQDSAIWLRVLKEVEAGRMPPDKSLSRTARISWKQSLESALNRRALPPRMLTSVEIDNDLSLLFGYYQNRYGPFDALKQQKLSDSRYRTVNSANLMSGDFLDSLQIALEQLIQDYTESRHEVAKGMRVGSTSTITLGVGELRPADSLTEGENQKDSTDVSLRIWEPARLKFAGVHPGRGMPPGRYRITFTANMVGRNLIDEKKKALTGSKLGRDQKSLQILMKDWEELYHSKARLTIQIGNHENRKNPVTKTIAEFDVDDERPRVFSHEFVLKTATFPYFCFENGPCENRWTQVMFGRERTKASQPYKWPNLHLRNMSITKVDDPQARSPYDVAYLMEGEFDDAEAHRRVREYARALGAPGSIELANRLFADLPDNFDVHQRYSKTLKLLSMSRDYLFLDFNASEEQAARFASYALLKRKPSDSFRADFDAFQSGRLPTDAFAERIINDPAFAQFLDEFVRGWFGEEVELDIEKYDKHTRRLDVDQEPVDYLKHIFTQNRPLREVFRSDYKVVNSSLAPYYHISGAKSGLPQVFNDGSGGVLQQMAFLKAQSDGIDGLPFRRSKWVLENVFNERISNPPNNVNNDEFVASIEVTTFKDRTQLHSKQRSCIECHKAIDPVAFAFQHMDVLGERIAEPETDYVKQLRERLASSEEEQVRAFATQLIQYIIGRETTIYDHKVIEDFLESRASGRYTSRSLLAHILAHYFKGA